jgi:hypothetical protein
LVDNKRYIIGHFKSTSGKDLYSWKRIDETPT